MAEHSDISWLDGGSTWNVVSGCTPVPFYLKQIYSEAGERLIEPELDGQRWTQSSR